MVSEAKRAANARNGKKSKGPVTEEGKKRSSMNSLKHGMTAQVAMLPDEDPAAYNERMAEWIDICAPQNNAELFRVKRAVYCSWQLQRVERAQSARLAFNAHSPAADRREELEKELTGLATRLFRGWSSLHAGGQPAENQGTQAADLHNDVVEAAFILVIGVVTDGVLAV